MIYYITCKYDTITGSSQDDGDGSRYSGFDHEVHTNHRFEIHETKPDYPDKTFSTSLDKAYFIAVIYGDGGTFGRTDGYVQYIGPFCKEKADTVIQLVNKVQREPRSCFNRDEAFNENKKSLEEICGDSFYAEWLGYFSSFEGMYLLCTDGSVTSV